MISEAEITAAARATALAINTTVWNAGCLRELMRKETASAERYLRVLEAHDPREALPIKMLRDYLAQLRGFAADLERSLRV